MKPGPFRKLVLIGPRAAGKTTLMPRLGAALGLPTCDTDHALAAAAGATAGELLVQLGEPEFRRREAAVVTAALTSAGTAVVALGGGAVLDASVAAALAAPDLLVVLLIASVAELARRQAAATLLRPALRGLPLPAEVRTLLAERLPRYRQLADLEIDTEAASAEQCTAAIVEAWQLRMPSR